MTENKQINLVINGQSKQDWEEYADEHPEVSSLSHLIRLSVQKEIAGAHDPQSSSSASEDPRMDELVEVVRGIDTAVNELTTRMRAVEREIEHRPEINELSKEVFEVLPDEEIGTRKQESKANQWTPEQAIVWTGDPKDIAHKLDVSRRYVEKALEQLLKDTHVVRSKTVNGKDCYWRVE